MLVFRSAACRVTCPPLDRPRYSYNLQFPLAPHFSDELLVVFEASTAVSVFPSASPSPLVFYLFTIPRNFHARLPSPTCSLCLST